MNYGRLFSLLVCVAGVNGLCSENSRCKTNDTCCLGKCIRRPSCSGFCRYNKDCPRGQLCDSDSKCTSACFSVRDCPTGFACNSASCIKKWRHGKPGNEVDVEPFSKIEESSSILGLLIAGIVALLFFAWICCQCFRFRLRRQDYQLGALRFDDFSSAQHTCEHDTCPRCDPNNNRSVDYDARSECRLSLGDSPPRYSTIFCGESPSTPPPTYDEALRIVRLTQTHVFVPNATGTTV